jgi:hypothetical protein
MSMKVFAFLTSYKGGPITVDRSKEAMWKFIITDILNKMGLGATGAEVVLVQEDKWADKKFKSSSPEALDKKKPLVAASITQYLHGYENIPLAYLGDLENRLIMIPDIIVQGSIVFLFGIKYVPVSEMPG